MPFWDNNQIVQFYRWTNSSFCWGNNISLVKLNSKWRSLLKANSNSSLEKEVSMLCRAPSSVFPALLAVGFGLHVVIQKTFPHETADSIPTLLQKNNILFPSFTEEYWVSFLSLIRTGFNDTITMQATHSHHFQYLMCKHFSKTLSRNCRVSVALHMEQLSATCLKLLGRFHMLCDKLHNKHSPPQFIALWTLWVQRTVRTKHCFSIVCDSVGCSAQRPSP